MNPTDTPPNVVAPRPLVVNVTAVLTFKRALLDTVSVLVLPPVDAVTVRVDKFVEPTVVE